MKSQVCRLPRESPRRALAQNSQPGVPISVIKQPGFAGVGGSLEQATRRMKCRKLRGTRPSERDSSATERGTPQARGCPGPLLKNEVVAGSLLVEGLAQHT